jgi:hypothetical protein
LAIEDIKSHKSPGVVQIPAELIKAGRRTIRYEIHKLIIYAWNKEEWKKSIIIPIYKKGDKTDYNNYRGISLFAAMYKILSDILLYRLTPYAEEIIGITSVDFDAKCQLLTICSAFAKYLRKNGNTTKQCIGSL